MKTLLVVLGIVALVGCGNNDSTAPTYTPDAAVAKNDTAPQATPDLAPVADVFIDPLLGSWVDEVSATSGVGVKFDGTNWQMNTVNQLPDGTVGLEVDKGTYDFADTSTVNLRATSSSCVGVANVTRAPLVTAFVRSSSGLTLYLGTQALLMIPSPGSQPGQGVAQIGCFLSTGFTLHAIAAVP